ncbi:MAG TPA: hypothetical protein VEG08_09255 [Terriglobales bacterium]|nr:hypothetical protein [Terriglobales bacterium]
MKGMVQNSYRLGWILLVLAVVTRILVYFDLGWRLVAIKVVPRNLLELSVVFFVICLASEAYGRATQK